MTSNKHKETFFKLVTRVMQNPHSHTLCGSFIEGFTIGAATPHADQPLLQAASEIS
jgi:hypothetical protein